MGGVSRRGVYYDLSLSPYVFNTPYGDILKFRSKKKLEIYTRDVPNQLEKLDRFIKKNGLSDFITPEMKKALENAVYLSFYRDVER